MATLSWNAFGERFFEAGLDHGVLYVDSDPGVAWPGLISVSETPSGGEPRPFYIDGVKFLNIASAEEFEATLTAVSYPVEFAPCDGSFSIQNGLFVTHQRRKSFGLSYRTRVGNDIDGVSHAYKIHLVYGCLTAPARRDNNTLSDSAAPSTLSWTITTTPPSITGYRRTAHLVLDSRYTDPTKLTAIEDLLYGTVSTDPSLPTPDALIALLEA